MGGKKRAKPKDAAAAYAAWEAARNQVQQAQSDYEAKQAEAAAAEEGLKAAKEAVVEAWKDLEQHAPASSSPSTKKKSGGRKRRSREEMQGYRDAVLKAMRKGKEYSSAELQKAVKFKGEGFSVSVLNPLKDEEKIAVEGRGTSATWTKL